MNADNHKVFSRYYFHILNENVHLTVHYKNRYMEVKIYLRTVPPDTDVFLCGFME